MSSMSQNNGAKIGCENKSIFKSMKFFKDENASGMGGLHFTPPPLVIH